MAFSGQQLLDIARPHIGERYVLGAMVPKNHADWVGPWDCAELASWCLFQVTGHLFGCSSISNPNTADAYTGYWQRDAKKFDCATTLTIARATAGAFLLRFPSGGAGHIAISDGLGGTVEAHSKSLGVIAGKVDGRRWDIGILPPMVTYPSIKDPVSPVAPGLVLRLKRPNMRGGLVRRVQEKLAELGISPGVADGKYGPHTAAAVRSFQLLQGLLPDGEVGPLTLAALGIKRGSTE